MDWYLPVLLGLAVVFSVVMYVVMDGFDLGVGILFPFAPSDADRAVMISSIAPFWDGNETWLVMGGTLLLAAFPLAYATLLPAFYVPLLTMLFALILRGIAFEFRFRASRFRNVWDWAFSGGSLLAALCQGMVLGGFIAGIPVEGRAFAGGTYDFLTAFAVVCGLGLAAGYALLGAAWLIFKTAATTAAYGNAAVRRHRQHLDAARLPAHRNAMVQLAQYLLPVAGADRDGARRLGHLAGDRRAIRGPPVPLLHHPVSASVSR